MTSVPIAAAMGPLGGLRAVELCDEKGAYGGKLLAGLGAEVLKIEPPGGDHTRHYGPFLDDQPDPEKSLWFWHYNTGKRSLVLDIEQTAEREQLRSLLSDVDIFLESAPPGRLAALGLDWPDLQALNPRLIMVSVTPFGRSGPRADEPATDLTLLAGGGPAWSCGYDDHNLPPVRGGGNQAWHIGGHFAVMSVLTALLVRNHTGRGQHIDVNIHAGANVTTEAGSYSWLVARQTVQRQTGRHAGVQMTMAAQIRCADGRWVNAGVPPRRPEHFAAVYQWLEEIGLLPEFPQAELLKLAAESEPIMPWQLAEDEFARAKFQAGREAMTFLAERLNAYDFFVQAQQRNFQVGIIYSPEEALEDPHFQARGITVSVEHEDLGRAFRYPGAPIHFSKSPWQPPTRAPHVGEH